MTDPMQRRACATYRARHFAYAASDDGKVATITLDRPERKNPLTFDAYAELRDLFQRLAHATDVKAVVVTGAGGNFSSGGDVHDIIGPLTKLDMPGLLAFTRMTGDLVKAMRACPQPIVAAVDGVCAGAGAMIALAADLRLGTPIARTAFLFVRVGLAGCDMGACTLLPRTIGQGRAAELLYTGRTMSAREGAAWGFFNRLVARRRAADGGAGACARARRRSHLCARHDQGADAPRMVDGPRRGDRRRGRGAGDLHADRRTSGAPTRRSSPRPSHASRATDVQTRSSRLAVLRRRAPSARRRCRGVAREPSFGRARHAGCRRRVSRLGARPRRRRLAAPLRAGAFRGRERRDRFARRSACCARRSPITTGSPISASRCRAWAVVRSRSRRTSDEPWRGIGCRGWRAGDAIAAFALSEPSAGSDAAALAMTARAHGDGYVLNGEKTWISNGGIADFYTMFARTGEAGSNGRVGVRRACEPRRGCGSPSASK